MKNIKSYEEFNESFHNWRDSVDDEDDEKGDELIDKDWRSDLTINDNIPLHSFHQTEPSDEEVTIALRKFFVGGRTEKLGKVEEKIKALLDIYHKWIEQGKKLYGLTDIAARLYQYQKEKDR